MQARARHDAWVLGLAALALIGVLGFDVAIPLGVAVGVPHVITVLVASRVTRPELVLVVAVASTVAIFVGWGLSPEGGEHWKVVANRGLAVFAVWAVSVMCYQSKRVRLSLDESHARLEGLVRQRTSEIQQANTALEQELAQRGQAERALRRSESELRIITDNLPALISYVDADCRYQFVNEKYAQQFGIPKEGIVGMHVSDLLGESVYKEIASQFDKVFAGERVQYEAPLPAIHDGGTRWISASFIPDVGSNGRVAGFFALIVDVTKNKQVDEERAKLLTLEKQARTEAEHAKQQTVAIFERVTDAFVALDTDQRYTYVNEKAAQALGHKREDLLGKHIWTIFPEGIGQPFHKAYEKAMREQVPVQLQEWYEPWGRWFENRVYPSPEGLSIFFQDVTQRVESEQELRLIKSAVEHAFDAVVITAIQPDAQDPRIEYVNAAFFQMTGYSSEDVIGQTLAVLSGAKTDPAVFDRMCSSPRLGKPCSGEMIGYRKDGGEFFLEWRQGPVRDAKGRITHWVSIHRDVTHRVELEERNRRHLEEAARIARVVSMGELASGLAHEINQPLTAVKAYCQMSLHMIEAGNWDKARLTVAVKETAVACERSCQIIHRLQNLVRKREPKCLSTQLNDIVRNALSLTQHQACLRGVSVRTELDNHLPLVMADRVQVEQVLLNLIGNGIDAMDVEASRGGDRSGPHEIVVYTRLVDGTGGVEVAVKDRGHGINGTAIEDLFQPLYTTKIDGVGVGLSISRSIIEAHRGRLWGTVNDSGGMTFRFTMPVENGC